MRTRYPVAKAQKDRYCQFMQILTHARIQATIKRLALEIIEHNHCEDALIILGINNNGFHFGKLLTEEIAQLHDIPTTLSRLRINPAAPLSAPVTLDLDIESLRDRVVILVDDVANTGRTMFYAFAPLLGVLPKRVRVAVLVDRKHKHFPVDTDYVGLSLATTLRETIDVRLRDVEEYGVYLVE